jgi:hypothetical protein
MSLGLLRGTIDEVYMIHAMYMFYVYISIFKCLLIEYVYILYAYIYVYMYLLGGSDYICDIGTAQSIR